MNNFQKMVKILAEAPYYKSNDYNPPKPLVSLSKNNLEQFWTLFKELDNNLFVFKRNDNKLFAIGVFDERFKVFSYVECTIPKTGTPKLKNSVQITEVFSNSKNTGYTRELYIEIAKKYNVISDFQQFGKAKNLWKSIARSQEIDVYLFNDITKTMIPYNGDNIPDDQIWGTDFTHMNIVLVGKKNKLVIE